jgi:hypothetical protein
MNLYHFQLEGVGCPASISYKTYFDTEEVRACCKSFTDFYYDLVKPSSSCLDNSQHSHAIGAENLPFTRRGRKEALTKEKSKSSHVTHPSTSSASGQAPTSSTGTTSASQPGSQSVGVNAAQPNSFNNAISMLAPIPSQSVYQQPSQPVTQPFVYSAPPQTFTASPPSQNQTYDRWENMATLFGSIRDHARSHEYPPVSVAALETILIRLYLESPVGMGLGTGPPMMNTVMSNNVRLNPSGSGGGGGNSSDASGAEESP